MIKPINTPTTLKIRNAVIDDAEAMMNLINEIIDTGIYTAMDEKITLESQIDFIKNFPENGTFLVACIGETLVGVQDVLPENDGQTGYISTFVQLDTLRKGVGQALMKKTFQRASELGYKTIIAEIRNDNDSAQRFYSAMGFKPAFESDGKNKVGKSGWVKLI